jgi:hypothetical protein
MGARTIPPLRSNLGDNVSIHAPAWARTLPLWARRLHSFNPRDHRRELVIADVAQIANHVSIHLPASQAGHGYFNQRACMGANATEETAQANNTLVQSTRLRGLRTPTRPT